MLGVSTGSVFGGAISAVLINIPGTPDAVPTMIEGHQLARKGEGGRALGMVTFGVFTMSDGNIWSMNISWALPVVWAGAV